MNPYTISASILSADFARLGAQVESVLSAGADMVHMDVMDNHYVPNLTMGPLVCRSLRRYGITAPIDVHLMVEPVDRLIEDFAQAGASYVTFHPEASKHVDRSLQLIRDHGCQAGLAINPATSLEILPYVVDKLDMILIMSVNPGFGGQRLIPGAMDKLRQVKNWLTQQEKACRLSVDGGVKADNIADLAAAGADTFVVGSALFGCGHLGEAMAQIRQKLAQG